jgi:hypothetical protein
MKYVIVTMIFVVACLESYGAGQMNPYPACVCSNNH